MFPGASGPIVPPASRVPAPISKARTPQLESLAVRRGIDPATLEAGEDAVVAVLEEALQAAVAANGLTASGTMRVRPTRPGEDPPAEAARPGDQPGAVLHLAEVDTI